MKRTHAGAAVLLSLATVLGTSGCYQGEGNTVTSQGPSGNGTNFTVSEHIQVQGLTIVSDGKSKATAIMTVLNTGDSDDALVTLQTEPVSSAVASRAPASSPSPSATAVKPTTPVPTTPVPTTPVPTTPVPTTTAPASVATTPEPVITNAATKSSAAVSTPAPAAPAGSLLALPAGEAVQVGGPAANTITLSGLTTTPGHYVSVTLGFAQAGSATHQVIVVPNTGFYASYGPGGAPAAATPSPASASSPAAAEH